MKRLVLLSLAACAGTSPPAEPVPAPYEPAPYRDPATLPGPMAMPTPAPVAEPVPEPWTPVDIATLDPLAVEPCNPGLAPLLQASPTRDATLASAASRAILGCLRDGQPDRARTLADVVVADTEDPQAHFLYAKTLLQQRKADESGCVHDTFLSAILDAVQAAASPEYSARMGADPAFEPVHHAYRYRASQLPSPAFPLDQRLTDTTWWGRGMGVWGSLVSLRLHAGGTATVSRRTVDDPDVGPSEWVDTAARWRMTDGALEVQLSDAWVPFVLDEPMATLTDTTGELGTLWDTPSECDA